MRSGLETRYAGLPGYFLFRLIEFRPRLAMESVQRHFQFEDCVSNPLLTKDVRRTSSGRKKTIVSGRLRNEISNDRRHRTTSPASPSSGKPEKHSAIT